MIQGTVHSRIFSDNVRLDASYQLSPGVQAMRRLKDFSLRRGETIRLAEVASVLAPKRFKREYASAAEEALPYLRPYDIFDYLPVPADRLSADRNPTIDELRLRDSSLIVTCSGRNLGPTVAVDAYLSRFVLSHDALRINVTDQAMRMYLLAFLNSDTGQMLIRRDMSGSVIDHITAQDVEALHIPIVKGPRRRRIVELMQASVWLRERARLALDEQHRRVEESLSAPKFLRTADGWTVNAASLRERVDAAPYLPLASQCAQVLRSAGGIPLREVAIAHKPASRYKAYHVTREYGRPFLAGGQIRQELVIAPKFMADRVFENPEPYRLHAGETVFAADGRAYEGLGLPVMVTPDRAGWLASEHVMRLRARRGVEPGWLYLAIANRHVQEQIQVLPRGSVVDTLYAEDLSNLIVIPPKLGDGSIASSAWRDFALADRLAIHSVNLVEAALHGDTVAAVRLTVDEKAALQAANGNRGSAA